jgi:hypothetical protein
MQKEWLVLMLLRGAEHVLRTGFYDIVFDQGVRSPAVQREVSPGIPLQFESSSIVEEPVVFERQLDFQHGCCRTI